MLVDTFIGRQPIFDRSMDVVAYEVLYRDGSSNSANFTNGASATAQVIVNTFVDVDIKRILGRKTGFVNMSRDFLVQRLALALPPGKTVIEVLEDVEIDDDVVAALEELSDGGYRIALDDFIFNTNQAELLPLADIVKVDIRALGMEKAEEVVKDLRPWGLTLLAEKVETHKEFWRCQQAGFDLFQGFFLAKPEVIRSRKMATNRAATVRLLSRVHDPDVTFDELAQLISQDVSISYRLLKLLNSSYYGLSRQIDSVHEGVIYLGLDRISQWVTMFAMASITSKPRELISTGLIRARMAELIGKATLDESTYRSFTVGLFSVLDGLLDQPMEQILKEMPLSSEAKEALLDYQGELGRILGAVLAYEKGDWDDVAKSGIDPVLASTSYLDAVTWADEAVAQLGAAV